MNGDNMQVPTTSGIRKPAAQVSNTVQAEIATAAQIPSASMATATATRAVPGGNSPANLTEAHAGSRGPVGQRAISPPRAIESGLNLANPEVVNHHNSLNLMKVCKESYTEHNYAVGHTQFLYRNYSDHQVLSFSGSKELKDWGHDANIIKRPVKDMGYVHSGFSSAYDEIKPLQDSVLDKKKPIVVCGHSLGGATATIAALDLKQRGYNVHSLTTFGCPRVGDPTFKAAYDKANIPSFRYVNSYDVVPRIPKINYEHVGTPFYLSSSGEMLKSQESIFKLWPWQIPGERVSSHHMPNYMANLGKFIS